MLSLLNDCQNTTDEDLVILRSAGLPPLSAVADDTTFGRVICEADSAFSDPLYYENVYGRPYSPFMTGIEDSIEVDFVPTDGFDQDSQISSFPSLSSSEPETPNVIDQHMPFMVVGPPAWSETPNSLPDEPSQLLPAQDNQITFCQGNEILPFAEDRRAGDVHQVSQLPQQALVRAKASTCTLCGKSFSSKNTLEYVSLKILISYVS